MNKKPKEASATAFGKGPAATVEHIPSIDGGDWETLVTIEHGIATRTYTSPGKLTKADALKNYNDGAWGVDFTDTSNAAGYCIEILVSHGWIEATAPFAPLQSHIKDFEVDMQINELATWEIEQGERSRFTALVWAIEKAGLRYEPVWYAAQILRHIEGPSDAAFIAGFMFRELTLRYRHEQDALRGKNTKAAARKGGEENARITREKTKAVIDSMQVYCDQGKGPSFAARLTYKKGLGTSEVANRALYYRYTGLTLKPESSDVI